MTAAVHVPAMLNINVRGQWITRQVTLIGVDEATYADVSDFREYLLHPENRKKLSFLLREDGYGDSDHEMPPSGWQYRRLKVAYEREFEAQEQAACGPPINPDAAQGETPAGSRRRAAIPPDPTARHSAATRSPRPLAAPQRSIRPSEQFTGIILGIAIGSVRQRDAEGKVVDYFLCRPGDDVRVTFPSAGTPPKAISDQFTVVDFYESKMSEYDSGFAFVPLAWLQAAAA